MGLTKTPDVRKTAFPSTYLPPDSVSPLGAFSTDFQKEWVEVVVVRETPDPCPPPFNPVLTSVFYPPLASATSDDLKVSSANGFLSTTRLSRTFGAENSHSVHGKQLLQLTC